MESLPTNLERSGIGTYALTSLSPLLISVQAAFCSMYQDFILEHCTTDKVKCPVTLCLPISNHNGSFLFHISYSSLRYLILSCRHASLFYILQVYYFFFILVTPDYYLIYDLYWLLVFFTVMYITSMIAVFHILSLPS